MTEEALRRLLKIWDSVASDPNLGPLVGTCAGILFAWRKEPGKWELLLGQRAFSSDYERDHLLPTGIPCGFGSWLGPGGSRKDPESLLGCALRETLEEFFYVKLPPVDLRVAEAFCSRLAPYLPTGVFSKPLKNGYSTKLGFTAYLVPLTAMPPAGFWKLNPAEFLVPPGERWHPVESVLEAPRQFPAWTLPHEPGSYFHIGLLEAVAHLYNKGAFD